MRELLISLIIIGSIGVTIPIILAELDKASEAEVHLRKACEVVWPDAVEYQIERCTKRAMAVMGDEDRLRDNELKRLLLASEKELATCKLALHEALLEKVIYIKCNEEKKIK